MIRYNPWASTRTATLMKGTRSTSKKNLSARAHSYMMCVGAKAMRTRNTDAQAQAQAHRRCNATNRRIMSDREKQHADTEREEWSQLNTKPRQKCCGSLGNPRTYEIHPCETRSKWHCRQRQSCLHDHANAHIPFKINARARHHTHQCHSNQTHRQA